MNEHYCDNLLCPKCQGGIDQIVARSKKHDDQMRGALTQVANGVMGELLRMTGADVVAVVVVKKGILSPVALSLFSTSEPAAEERLRAGLSTLIQTLVPEASLVSQTSVTVTPPPPNNPGGN